MAKQAAAGVEERLTAIDTIYKDFGDDSISILGHGKIHKVDVISTGAFAIDNMLGIGGVPRGRVTEIYGPESCGKTTLCQHIVAEAQALGLRAAYVDSEHAIDPGYMTATGIDIDKLWVAQPDNGEKALGMVDRLCMSGEFGLVIVDSVPMLTPQAEIEGEMGDAQIGALARLMGKGMRKITPHAGETKTAVVFINQIRDKIGVMYGSPETTPGGRALRFQASVRVDMRKRDAMKGSDKEIVGNITHLKTVKNKLAPPARECDVKILYGEGISKEDSLLDPAVAAGVLGKSGSWFTYNDENVANGREAMRIHLKEHPDFTKALTDTLAGMDWNA